LLFRIRQLWTLLAYGPGLVENICSRRKWRRKKFYNVENQFDDGADVDADDDDEEEEFN